MRAQTALSADFHGRNMLFQQTSLESGNETFSQFAERTRASAKRSHSSPVKN